jgi:hypothetical protein
MPLFHFAAQYRGAKSGPQWGDAPAGCWSPTLTMMIKGRRKLENSGARPDDGAFENLSHYSSL